MGCPETCTSSFRFLICSNMNTFLRVTYIIILIYHNSRVFCARRERFLHFPPKTNIVITMSLLKLFPNDSILNSLTEFDVFFPVPSHPFEHRPRIKREADRKMIFSRLKEAADTFGLDSNSCLQQLICELQNSLPPSTHDEDNLLYDMFNIIFEPDQRILASECEDRQNTCQIPSWINF